MPIINLTKHEVNIVRPEGTYTLEGVDKPARVKSQTEILGWMHENGFAFPVQRTNYGEVEGLPDPVAGTIYLVSSMVASALPERTDLVVPADRIKDSSGNITGCRSLGVIAPKPVEPVHRPTTGQVFALLGTGFATGILACGAWLASILL